MHELLVADATVSGVIPAPSSCSQSRNKKLNFTMEPFLTQGTNQALFKREIALFPSVESGERARPTATAGR
ncbi:hypothetical protein GGR26_001737 [Lewinella marina]|nr:hypothetical protein [Neolewinella marina]